MSTCSFSSYLSARASFIAAAPATADAPVSASGLTAITAPVPAHSRHHHPHTTHHLDHVAPSPSLSDAGSPFKRQRNRSPDSTTTVVAVAPAASVLPAPERTIIAADNDTSMSASVAAASYFAAFQHHGPPPSGLSPPTPSSSPLHTPLVAPVPKSILCVPSSPLRYVHTCVTCTPTCGD